jgi:hypothetical protein
MWGSAQADRSIIEVLGDGPSAPASLRRCRESPWPGKSDGGSPPSRLRPGRCRHLLAGAAHRPPGPPVTSLLVASPACRRGSPVTGYEARFGGPRHPAPMSRQLRLPPDSVPRSPPWQRLRPTPPRNRLRPTPSGDPHCATPASAGRSRWQSPALLDARFGEQPGPGAGYRPLLAEAGFRTPPVTCLQAPYAGGPMAVPSPGSFFGRTLREADGKDGRQRQEGRWAQRCAPAADEGNSSKGHHGAGNGRFPPPRKGRETFPQRAGPHSRKRGATNPRPDRGENRRGGAKPRGRNGSRGLATSTRRKRKLPGVDADGGYGRGADVANPTRGGTPTSSEVARSSSGDESALKERRRP